MNAPQRTHVLTDDPTGVALRTIGKAAREAAGTWTIQEWAARLATRAGPRDYVGQLKRLYDGILQRWRYTMEPGERVPESARALLSYTLGTKYNKGPTCPTFERCDVSKTKWRERGWGDCDDVSALVAAGAMALGMTPYFRTVHWPGGGHVSVTVETPRGQFVNLDPVGHPDKPFGWAMRRAGARVAFFDMHGAPALVRDSALRTNVAKQQRSNAMGYVVEPELYLSGMGANAHMPATYLGAFGPRAIQAFMHSKVATPHTVMVRPDDRRGSRILTLPEHTMRMFRRGMVVDGARAVDQFGEVYEYMGGLDAWGPEGQCVPGQRMSHYYSGFMGGRAARKKRRKARRSRRRKKIKKVFKKIGKAIKKVVQWGRKTAVKILTSKLARRMIGTVYGIFGVPQAAVDKILKTAAAVVNATGKLGPLVKMMLRGQWKKAAKAVRDEAKAKGLMSGWDQQAAASPASAAMRQAFDQDDEMQQAGQCRVWETGGRQYPVAPVLAMLGEPEIAEPDALEVKTSPADPFEPGHYRRFAFGESLLGNIKRIYGLSGGSSLRRAQEVNAIPYNRKFWTPPDNDFERKYFPDGLISARPKFACDPVAQWRSPDGGDGGCYAAPWWPIADEPPPDMVTKQAAPIEPTPLPDIDDPEPVPIPPEPEPTPAELETPPMPSQPCPAGYFYVLVEDFKDPTTGQNVPAGWVCRPDPTLEPSTTPTQPTPAPPEPEPVPAPTYKPTTPAVPATPEQLEPTPPDPGKNGGGLPPPAPTPTPAPPPAPTGPVPGMQREPACPPGAKIVWASGQAGFGPYICKSVTTLPSPRPTAPPAPTGPVPGMERPTCPPGSSQVWTSGTPGFGPYICQSTSAPARPTQPGPAPGKGGGMALSLPLLLTAASLLL